MCNFLRRLFGNNRSKTPPNMQSIFKTSTGEFIDPSVSIFPLITFLPDKKVFKCLGTGFFINPFGGFITAKHVFFDNKGKHVPTLYAIQSLSNGERIIRKLSHFIPHPNADIGIGMLGSIIDSKGNTLDRPIPVPPSFPISTKPINIGDSVQTYAFPRTEVSDTDDDQQLFTFKWRHESGTIMDYCPDGSPVVRNPCYHTSMQILDGASGGPVFRNNHVIGVNSSGFELPEGEEPISYITPISFIQELYVPQGGKKVSVKELIEEGFIASDFSR